MNGPMTTVFRTHAPVVGLPVVGFPGPGVDSPCGGGLLAIGNEARITEGQTWYGEIGNPDQDQTEWVIATNIELLKC